MVWDFVYARRLLSNGTYHPIHDAVLGFEHCMVAKARRWTRRRGTSRGLPADAAAAEALRGAAAGAGGAAPPGRHAGLPRGRDEAVAGQQQGAAHGGGAPQTTEVERGGRPYKPSLLLTGLPGTGKTHLARTIVARARRRLVSKTHCSAQNLGLGAQTTGWPTMGAQVRWSRPRRG